MARLCLLTVVFGVACAMPGRPITPTAACDGGTQCGSDCVDTSRSTEHCGTCDNVCNSGESCRGGNCIVGCVGSTMLCGTSCVDVDSNPAHCGACGTTCSSTQTCVAGVCKLSCGGGLTSCPSDLGDVCVNEDSDALHCGSCSVACDQGYVCSKGACTISCSPPQTACSNLYCANLITDGSNCGTCGNVCASGTTCVASGTGAPSTCQIVCPTGQTLCGTTCYDLTTNPMHCGGCNTACTAQQGCVGSACLNLCTNIAHSATGTDSGGGAGPYGPTALNNGVGPTCTAYAWITNTTSASGKWMQLSWSSAQQIGSFYIQSDDSAGSMCGTKGRNVASATVQWWNGSSWITAGSISGQTGSVVRYDFPSPVTTTQVRLYDVACGAGGINTLVFEWYVFPVAGCSP